MIDSGVVLLTGNQVRIDHSTASVSFGTGVGMTQDIAREGPSIQSMPSEQMRYQLINMAVALDKAMVIVSPNELKVNWLPVWKFCVVALNKSTADTTTTRHL